MKTKTKILPRKRAADPRSANQIASDRDYAKRFPLKAAEDRALTKRLAAHSRRAKRVRAGATTAVNVSQLKLELRAAMARNDEIGAELSRCRAILARHGHDSPPPCMTVGAMHEALDMVVVDRGTISHRSEAWPVRISYFLIDGGLRADDIVSVSVSKDHHGQPAVYLQARSAHDYKVEHSDF